MREMTVKEIQAIDFEILKRIDAFCKLNGIKYWLSDGTLIGAIRHKGFIPWDDDLDISMMRDDYERFVKEFKNDSDYRLYAPQRGNSYLPYARVCEMKKTFFRQINPWTNESPGVGVDIFPVDIAPDDEKVFEEYAESIYYKIIDTWKVRELLKSGETNGLFDYLADLYRRKIRYPMKLRKIIRRIKRKRLAYRNASGEYCFTIITHCSWRKYWKTAWFERTIEWDFEGMKFPVPIGYHERLSAEYGDYMQLPPENERNNHASIQTMLWRE